LGRYGRSSNRGLRALTGLAVLGWLVTLAACAGRAPAAPGANPAAASPPQAAASVDRPAAGASGAESRAEWEQIVAAAKREGKVAVRGPAGADIREALAGAFQRQYPEIQVDYTGARGAELVAKLLPEIQAGQHLADILITGTTDIVATMIPAGAVVPVQPYLVGPETRDASKWLGGKLDFADDDGRYNLVYTGTVKVPLAYNPRLVAAGEITSYRDLLDPKWRGKVSMLDPRTAGPGLAMATFFYIAPALGKEYLEQLFASGIVFSKDERQVLDWVGRGQYPIALAPNEGLAPEMMKKGVPVELLGAEALREGSYVTAASGSLSVLNNAPHPNAIKVYVNWLLSKEGQTEVSRASGFPSRRLDVPGDHLNPAMVPREGASYLQPYKEPYIRMKGEVEDYLRAVVRD
jgi:ABC-type Fe3+ transport system substrate-binding protein